MTLLLKKPVFMKKMFKTIALGVVSSVMMAAPALALDKSEAEGFTNALIAELGQIAAYGA